MDVCMHGSWFLSGDDGNWTFALENDNREMRP